MNWILFDGVERINLLPLTFAKPIGLLRVGILTIEEKWQHYLGNDKSYMTDPYLEAKYGLNITEDNLVVNSAVLPNEKLIQEVISLKQGQRLIGNSTVIAFRLSGDDIAAGNLQAGEDIQVRSEFDMIRHPWDIFAKNGAEIVNDLKIIKPRKITAVPKHLRLIGNDLYVEDGVELTDAAINTDSGPVYLGKNVKVLEGSLIRGPFAANEGAVIKMGAKMYGDTTIGPYSKVGGEISNSVIQGYSNKGHDGYLGNSVLGEWCNLGADTNSSNLKNNYSNVKVWNYKEAGLINSGLTFCGLIMGDHSKTSINSMLNTGTIVGFSSNIFCSGFPPKFVPSFTWGGGSNSTEFKLDKAMEVAERMMQRRNVTFNEVDRTIFGHIFTQTAKFRTY